MLSYAFVLLHLSILLAGFTGVLGRLITLNEGLLVWYRVMFASGFFLLYLLVKHGQIRLPLKDILRIAWVGFTAIIDPVWSKRAFSLREIAFSLLTIIGIALIFHFDTRYQVGIVLGVLSAVAAAFLTIENRRVGSDYPLMTFLFYEIAASFVIIMKSPPVSSS